MLGVPKYTVNTQPQLELYQTHPSFQRAVKLLNTTATLEQQQVSNCQANDGPTPHAVQPLSALTSHFSPPHRPSLARVSPVHSGAHSAWTLQRGSATVV
jgi:hypothetical protein